MAGTLLAGTLRLIRAIAAALLLAASPALAAPQRVVAVGDLHGDFSAWTDIARDAGLEDSAGHWTGGNTILVQLGDIVDRGPDSRLIITNLRQLQKEAQKAGGRVIVVLGNHEAMNVTGDLRYVTPAEFAAFATPQSEATRTKYYAANKVKIEADAKKADPSISPAAVRDAWMKSHPLGWAEHRQAWAPNGDIGRWAASNPAIVKLSGTLFVHGGISEELSKLSFDDVNRRVASAMAKADSSDGSILFDPLGPLWYRGLLIRDADAEATRRAAGKASPKPGDELDTVLAAYGAKRLVVAHTPRLAGILIDQGGKLARVDTGNSRYYGGQLSWLEINGDRMVPHAVKRSGK